MIAAFESAFCIGCDRALQRQDPPAVLSTPNPGVLTEPEPWQGLSATGNQLHSGRESCETQPSGVFADGDSDGFDEVFGQVLLPGKRASSAVSGLRFPDFELPAVVVAERGAVVVLCEEGQRFLVEGSVRQVLSELRECGTRLSAECRVSSELLWPPVVL